jgi:hypothetical protein
MFFANQILAILPFFALGAIMAIVCCQKMSAILGKPTILPLTLLSAVFTSAKISVVQKQFKNYPYFEVTHI